MSDDLDSENAHKLDKVHAPKLRIYKLRIYNVDRFRSPDTTYSL